MQIAVLPMHLAQQICTRHPRSQAYIANLPIFLNNEPDVDMYDSMSVRDVTDVAAIALTSRGYHGILL